MVELNSKIHSSNKSQLHIFKDVDILVMGGQGEHIGLLYWDVKHLSKPPSLFRLDYSPTFISSFSSFEKGFYVADESNCHNYKLKSEH